MRRDSVIPAVNLKAFFNAIARRQKLKTDQPQNNTEPVHTIVLRNETGTQPTNFRYHGEPQQFKVEGDNNIDVKRMIFKR